MYGVHRSSCMFSLGYSRTAQSRGHHCLRHPHVTPAVTDSGQKFHHQQEAAFLSSSAPVLLNIPPSLLPSAVVRRVQKAILDCSRPLPLFLNPSFSFFKTTQISPWLKPRSNKPHRVSSSFLSVTVVLERQVNFLVGSFVGF